MYHHRGNIGFPEQFIYVIFECLYVFRNNSVRKEYAFLKTRITNKIFEVRLPFFNPTYVSVSYSMINFSLLSVCTLTLKVLFLFLFSFINGKQIRDNLLFMSINLTLTLVLHQTLFVGLTGGSI